jgi:hypothetical protein
MTLLRIVSGISRFYRLPRISKNECVLFFLRTGVSRAEGVSPDLVGAAGILLSQGTAYEISLHLQDVWLISPSEWLTAPTQSLLALTSDETND